MKSRIASGRRCKTARAVRRRDLAIASVGATIWALPAIARGQTIYVATYPPSVIGEYTTSGGTVNANLITGLNSGDGLALSGSDLFVTNANNGTVGEYICGEMFRPQTRGRSVRLHEFHERLDFSEIVAERRGRELSRPSLGKFVGEKTAHEFAQC